MIDPNDFNKFQAARTVTPASDGAHRVCVDSLPVAGSHTASCDDGLDGASPELPDDFAPIDNKFLNRIRALALLV